MPAKDVLAAGVVVFRPGKRVLLVHRPRYDDWSFPKGKLDRGEHVAVAAVREVAEETGLHVRLGPPLAGQRYAVSGGRMKAVSYWVGRAVGSDDVSGYRANAEIDRVEWVPYDEALDRLSYEHDQETLREARPLRRPTRAIVVLRHGDARSRKAWRRQDDRLRPLLQAGRQQAQRVIPVLAAYDVTRIVSSSSTRCVETVAPYADTTGWKLELEDGLSEEAASAEGVVGLVDELLAADEGSVVCSHRPVLPTVFDALGVRDPKLETGGLLVAHVRKGQVLATEAHQIH
ncbi:NUDIX domain-containing protein [Nocardioides sp. MAH-18]|uniref:NUDIX domain-containing protein n=1 Tax=Nocardioides agri TaxID=2682843 RepID=A0A6L6XQ38_9ACTN|nr:MULTISPECIES: NUDIX hydrolase [unclassified Nocardioides]MBA2954593.1 NUDIX hydrolase [Nocardioides sp. CGMCC 1.13656]MVQ49451.1 NUDIX domain-containing protein [Nocardioides sp. MAH-18]